MSRPAIPAWILFSAPTAGDLQISAIGYALVSAATKPVIIYVAGDSTVCDQTDTDYAGWAEMIPQYFAPPADVANYADSGESSASFLASGAEWGTVKSLMTTGDWVLIQFGHNDKTTTSADFQANITQMVKDAKAKGVTPVLISPPARATFSGQTLTDQSSLHSADMQAVATAQSVAYIDLTSITTAWYNQIGPNGLAAVPRARHGHDPHQRRRRREDRRIRRGRDQVAEHRPRQVPAIAGPGLDRATAR